MGNCFETIRSSELETNFSGRMANSTIRRFVGQGRLPAPNFFFLYCRTSTRHCRSTTGLEEDSNRISDRIFPGSKQTTTKPNKNPHPNSKKQTNKQEQRTTAREIRKKVRQVKLNASLSAPHMFSSTLK